jgi:hypothetical protein
MVTASELQNLMSDESEVDSGSVFTDMESEFHQKIAADGFETFLFENGKDDELEYLIIPNWEDEIREHLLDR